MATIPPVSAAEFFATDFDYLIVGAGTAGLAVAARLSEDPNVHVGIIEAGELVLDMPEINIPGMVGKSLGTDVDWKFATVPQEHAANRQIGQPRGKVVGGSSALNFAALGRASAAEYDAYETLGNDGWNWDEFLKYLKKSENFTPPPGDFATKHKVDYTDEFHGRDGPIHKIFPNWINDLHVPFAEASVASGVPYNIDTGSGRNGGTYTGAFCVDPSTATRSYSTTGYYLPNIRRKNMSLLTGAHVSKVLLDSSSGEVIATGVEFMKDGTTTVVKAKREIILAAGSFQTPQLLELSGIGKSDVLKKYGIEQVIELPVGENLQDHAWVSFVFEVANDITTFESLAESPDVVAENMRLYQEERKGMFSSVFSSYNFAPLHSLFTTEELKAFTNDLDQAFPETPLGQKYRALYKTWAEDKGHAQLEILQTPGFLSFGAARPKPNVHYNTFMAGILHPLSRGSVHIGSSDPFAAPLIDPAFLKDPRDTRLLVKLVSYCRELAGADAYKSASPVPYDPPSDMDGEELEKWVRSIVSSFFHPIGTAIMLPKADGGVVDPRLKVYGTKNLRVADASVIPFVPSCHIQSTVYAIAEKAADIIKADNA